VTGTALLGGLQLSRQRQQHPAAAAVAAEFQIERWHAQGYQPRGRLDGAVARAVPSADAGRVAGFHSRHAEEVP
jgi:hypothetical protein